MYDYAILQYLGEKFGVIPTILILFAPSLSIFYVLFLRLRKQISEKQFVYWESLCLALITMWAILFFGFYWWKALLAAPAAFVFGKFQMESTLRLGKRAKKAREKI